MKSILFILALAAFALAQKSINIKDAIDKIKKCYSADKNQFNSCLLEFWKEVRPLLADGIPELKIPKLDPLSIDRIDFAENGAVVTGKSSFTNILVKGLREYVPKNVVADIKAQTITVELQIPIMEVNGHYDIDGEALLLPVKGNGPFWLKLTGVEGKAVAHVERDGAGVRLASTDIDFNIQKIEARLDNLLGGQDVGEAINNLINDNAQEIVKDVKPQVSKKLGEAITKILAGSIKELPGEAFVLPEGFVPPEGVVVPEGFTGRR